VHKNYRNTVTRGLMFMQQFGEIARKVLLENKAGDVRKM